MEHHLQIQGIDGSSASSHLTANEELEIKSYLNKKQVTRRETLSEAGGAHFYSKKNCPVLRPDYIDSPVNSGTPVEDAMTANKSTPIESK